MGTVGVSCPSLLVLPEAPPATAGGQLTPSTPIACQTLHAVVPASCCVLRQLVSERQRTRDVWRGQGSDHPTCTERCAQGVAIRAELAGALPAAWRGVGPGHRFTRTRDDVEAQYRARMRQERSGLLAPVPTVDLPPGESDPPEARSIVGILTSDH
ncbi:MAG: hypothetical protein NDI82_02295 [Anaeromyxobacteraceae bacterium]|nr:hypothetical protein [Anaeromyxobacteraceae bacterium]